MYRALWDRRHEGATRISQCTRRVAPSALTYPSGPWLKSLNKRCRDGQRAIGIFPFDQKGVAGGSCILLLYYIASISFNESVRISIRISLKFVDKGPINIIQALVQTMVLRRPGDKPLFEPLMVFSKTWYGKRYTIVCNHGYISGQIKQFKLKKTCPTNSWWRTNPTDFGREIENCYISA